MKFPLLYSIIIILLTSSSQQEEVLIINYQKSLSEQLKLPSLDSGFLDNVNASLKKNNYLLVFDETNSKFFIENKKDLVVEENNDKNSFKATFLNNISNTEEEYFTDKSLKSIFHRVKERIWIKMQYNQVNWKIDTSKVKTIFGYKCVYASAIVEQDRLNLAFFNLEKKEQKVIVWFAPEFPIKGYGPEAYSGLPGLVFECDDGKFKYQIQDIQEVNHFDKNNLTNFKKENAMTNEEYKESLLNKIP